MTNGTQPESPGIEGIPSTDGCYWYYKRASILPTLVLVGTRHGERVIKDGSEIRRHWYPGEFFVGPIRPPYPTPDHLAKLQPGTHGEELHMHKAAAPETERFVDFREYLRETA